MRNKGTLARVGVGNADVRVGGTLYRGVEVVGLDYNQLEANDKVALEWKGERPYVTDLLDYRETEDGVPASNATSATSATSVTIVETRTESITFVDDNGGVAEPDDDSELRVQSGTAMDVDASASVVLFSHGTGTTDLHTNYAEHATAEDITALWQFCASLMISDTGAITASGTLAPLDVRHVTTDGAKPVMRLEQEDVDEPFIKFVGTAAAATLTNSIVAEADVTTATRAGWVKVELEDEGNQVTDQDYYIPVYTLT